MARPRIWVDVIIYHCICGRQLHVHKGDAAQITFVNRTENGVVYSYCTSHEVVTLPEPESWAPWMSALASNA